MGDLIKRLFWPKRDYTIILDQESNLKASGYRLKKFMENIENNEGKIKNIYPLSDISGGGSFHPTDGSGIDYAGNAPIHTNFSFFIHYKCYKKLEENLTESEKEEIFDINHPELRELLYKRHHQNL